MKSYKKITETAQTFNFSDFPLILCGNGPKGTKTTQTQTLFSQIGTFFGGIQGIPSESWRPGLSENVVVFVAIIFWTRVTASQSWVKFHRKKVVKLNHLKITWLQFCVTSLHMNRICVSHGTFEVLFISEPKTQNCSRVIFPNGFLFLLPLLKFQTLMTLSSHSSGLKNYSNKNHHIFRKPWTSKHSFGPLPQKINGKSLKLAVWTVSVNFL